MKSLIKKPLENIGVLVTRPKQQAQPLCQRIEAFGGQAILFPTLAIIPASENIMLIDQVEKLDQIDIAIFISPNAVSMAHEVILKRWQNLPEQTKFLAIGPGTAQLMDRYNILVDAVPHHPFNSESLLDLPILQDVKQKKILIFCGEGGRDLLKTTLAERGAEVALAMAYQRGCPKIETDELIQSFIDCKIHIVISTSNTGLENLVKLVGEQHKKHLLKTPLLVISKRMAQYAKKLGLNKILIADSASEAAIVKQLVKEFKDGKHRH